MLDQQFISTGYRYISPSHYLKTTNLDSLNELKKIFDLELDDDGSAFRKRAYMKLLWDRQAQEISLARNQNYFQTMTSNKKDGGKIRKFKILDPQILEINILHTLIEQNIKMINDYELLHKENILTIGMHFIRYQTTEGQASYSSPDWLHKDDEPLVFVHLVNLSKSALGGDNLIADEKNRNVTNVLRLENALDTLVVNKHVYHAVTPLGSREGIALRDVILFTIEPTYTQQ